MIRFTVLGSIVMVMALMGCGGQSTETAVQETAPAVETPAAAAEPNHEIPMRNFAPTTIGPYAVQPMYEEEIEDGHYNIKVEGGDFAAVRVWAGLEDPGDVMVVKCDLENEYQHGHLDIPNPIPADYALWIEIEDTEGNTHLGSTPLKGLE